MTNGVAVSNERSDCLADVDISARIPGKYLTFKIANAEYALAIMCVREIVGLMEITSVPRMLHFMRGVVNLRGSVIPVVDLRLKFEMPAIEATAQAVIIVVYCTVGTKCTTIGILVDEVLEVLNIAAEQVEGPPRLSTSRREMDVIHGIGKVDRRVICLLDIERLFLSTGASPLLDTEASATQEPPHAVTRK